MLESNSTNAKQRSPCRCLRTSPTRQRLNVPTLVPKVSHRQQRYPCSAISICRALMRSWLRHLIRVGVAGRGKAWRGVGRLSCRVMQRRRWSINCCKQLDFVKWILPKHQGSYRSPQAPSPPHISGIMYLASCRIHAVAHGLTAL